MVIISIIVYKVDCFRALEYIILSESIRERLKYNTLEGNHIHFNVCGFMSSHTNVLYLAVLCLDWLCE